VALGYDLRVRLSAYFYVSPADVDTVWVS